MPEISNNTIASLSDAARADSTTYTIYQPVEGLDTPLVMSSRFDFKLDRLIFRTQDGAADIYVYIDGVLVEWEDTQTAGELQADEGPLKETIPDSTSAANYTVRQGSRLSVVIDNITTHTSVVELQFDYTTLQVNDESV